jgi:hypothetical protein
MRSAYPTIRGTRSLRLLWSANRSANHGVEVLVERVRLWLQRNA